MSSFVASRFLCSLLKILGNLLKHPSLKLGLSVMELWEQIFKHHADNILKARSPCGLLCSFSLCVVSSRPVAQKEYRKDLVTELFKFAVIKLMKTKPSTAATASAHGPGLALICACRCLCLCLCLCVAHRL